MISNPRQILPRLTTSKAIKTIKMKDIETIRNALSRRHPCSKECQALKRIEELLKEAPGLFRYDLNETRFDWLKRAGQLEDNEDEPCIIMRS